MMGAGQKTSLEMKRESLCLQSGMKRLRMAAGHQVVDSDPHLVGGAETLLIEVVNVKLHGDELQPVFIRNDDPDGNACIFDNLFFHA